MTSMVSSPFEMPYSGDEEDFPGTPLTTLSVKPKRVPDMVFGTPVPEIPSAKAGVDYAYKVAALAGYKVVKLLGKDANLANYRNYLSGHLKAFGNIGHGYTGGIVLYDGNSDVRVVLPPDEERRFGPKSSISIPAKSSILPAACRL